MADQTHTHHRPPIASAVITHEGKVLLVRRRVKEGSLSWQFPGGEVESGETASQAAVREVHEETNLLVADTKLLGERVHPNTGRIMIYVACVVVSGDPVVVDDDELDALAWATPNEIKEYVPHGFYEPVQQYLDTELK